MPRKRKAVPSEIFISHSNKNASFVNRLKEVLAAHGLKSFMSKTSIRGAQQWHDEIGTALRRCDWFLLILSPQSVTSAWVNHELIYALQENRYRGGSSRLSIERVIRMPFLGPFLPSNGSTSAGISTMRVNNC
jgi:hypothetical protein